MLTENRNCMAEDENGNESEDSIIRTVRFPLDLYDAIKRDAKKNRRSTALHIVWLVEKGMEEQERSRGG